MQRRRYPWDLLLVSATAFCYLAARAWMQSVTIDEASVFLTYATGSISAAWSPTAANHVLNTLLERLSWSIFGFNQVAMRLPALLGAVVYLGSAASICTRLPGRAFRMLAFVAVVFNPFVLDYLVAARGYSLAVGLLLGAVAVFWGLLDREPGTALIGRCVLASVLLGLSFAANFSFAIADVLTGAIAVAVLSISENWRLRSNGKPPLSRQQLMLLVIGGTVPGIAVAFLLCGSVLLHWSAGQFVFGAFSLQEMWQSLFHASFPPPDPKIVNETLYPAWARLALPLCALAMVSLGAQFAGIVSIRHIRSTLHLRVSALMSTSLLSVVILTLMLHWTAFHAFHLLLPQARTGLFFAPLLTLAFVAGIDALRGEPRLSKLSGMGMAILAGCSVYFLSCLRLHYFQEWRFNEDTKAVFWVLRDIEQKCGIHEFVTEWQDYPGLTFYKREYGSQAMKPFVRALNPPCPVCGPSDESWPKGRQSYVFSSADGQDLLKQERLTVWYDNPETGMAVGVRSCLGSAPE